MLIDGNALVHRAYHALPPLTVKKTGETVNAVYGFAMMLLKVLNELKPAHCAIAFDTSGPTFRHRIYNQYKAQRPRTPIDLLGQIKRVKQLTSSLGIPIFELEDYEADDVLGALSHQAVQQGVETVIVTGDADTMQLISPHIKVLYPKPRGSFSDTLLYDEAAVEQRYKVPPHYITDLKGLVGDPSDNIPGVPGIGVKTAAKLIQQFGSIEQIYQSINLVTPSRLQALLRDNEDIAYQSKKLATIITDLPLDLKLDDCRLGFKNRNQVTELFRELEFFSLLPRLYEIEAANQPTSIEIKHVSTDTDYQIISTTSGLNQLIRRLSTAKFFSFNVETEDRNAMRTRIIGLTFSPTAGEAYYIPVGHTGLWQTEQLPLTQVINQLQIIMEDSTISKIAHDAKFSMIVLAEHGVNVANLVFDTMVASYLLGDQSRTLASLAFNQMGIELAKPVDLTYSGPTTNLANLNIDKVTKYVCTKADVTKQLSEILGKQLHQQGLWHLFTEIEIPLIPVLTQMERYGITIDITLLQRMSQDLGKQLKSLESTIYYYIGHEFNINSPQQLSSVLYQELELPTPRKTKSGYSTGAAILEKLQEVHPVIKTILDYRQLTKLKSTYVDALPSLINPKTGRVHTNFNQTKTATGRLSSSEPNVQNIPIRTVLGREIRKAFIAPTDGQFMSGDYSQIDLRALAHLSQDKQLFSAFKRGEDIHSITATRLYNVDASEVNSEMRRLAKTVNFGIVYGMSDYGLQKTTGLSIKEATKFIDSYFANFPEVKQYLEATKQHARDTGYVQTLLGRRRYIPEINSNNRLLRSSAERMAINMPVQGTSADIIKVAMIQIQNEVVKRSLSSKMLLQVHDELLFEVPQNELHEMYLLVSQTMCSAIVLSVPLMVDIKVGTSWGELEEGNF